MDNENENGRDFAVDFGRFLRRERQAHGLTSQGYFAEALGNLEIGAVQISTSGIGHVESGRRLISPAVFDACARLFKWGPSDFQRRFRQAYGRAA